MQIQAVMRRCKFTAFNNTAFQNPGEILSSIFKLVLERIHKSFTFNVLQDILNFGLLISSFTLQDDLAGLHSHLFCQWSIILFHFILKCQSTSPCRTVKEETQLMKATKLKAAPPAKQNQ